MGLILMAKAPNSKPELALIRRVLPLPCCHDDDQNCEPVEGAPVAETKISVHSHTQVKNNETEASSGLVIAFSFALK